MEEELYAAILNLHQLCRSLKTYYGLETVTCTYDGSGDSGEVENVEFTPEPRWRSEARQKQVTDFFEDSVYRILAHVAGGWEINEGSRGSLEVNCAEGTLILHHYWNKEDYDAETEETTFLEPEYQCTDLSGTLQLILEQEAALDQKEVERLRKDFERSLDSLFEGRDAA